MAEKISVVFISVALLTLQIAQLYNKFFLEALQGLMNLQSFVIFKGDTIGLSSEHRGVGEESPSPEIF